MARLHAIPRACLALALLTPMTWVLPAHAASLPLWELGIGAVGMSVPDYRGSDQRHFRALPLPYVVYRGEHLRADREGLRAMFFNSERMELNISAFGALPVRSNDNDARRGMRDLDTTVELGPALNFFLGPPGQRKSLQLRLPLRAGLTLDWPPRHVGWVFAPNLLWQARGLGSERAWNVGVSGGPLWQARRYNATYYSVTPAEATAARPAYDAPGGYAGAQITFTVSRRFPRYWVAGFLRADSLSGSSFDNSPLMRSRSAFYAGVGVSFLLGQSSTRVESFD